MTHEDWEILKNSYFYAIIRKKRGVVFMKIHGVKREWSHPIFCIKKHYCPHCNEMLEKTKTETVVNSKSEEAKNYDFSQAGGDGYMMGNIKFIRTAFRCNKCDKTYSIKELLKIEKNA
jgi:hypothetical protein